MIAAVVFDIQAFAISRTNSGTNEDGLIYNKDVKGDIFICRYRIKIDYCDRAL